MHLFLMLFLPSLPSLSESQVLLPDLLNHAVLSLHWRVSRTQLLDAADLWMHCYYFSS